MAPLAVFFDTTAQGRLSDGSYLEATCLWNFGDTKSNPLYAQGNGFVAAHVFEKAGDYTVTTEVYQKDGTCSTVSTVISVADFDDAALDGVGGTYYVSSSGNDGNDGKSEATAFQTANKALGKIKAGPSTNNVRILFRRGDRFDLKDQGSNSGSYALDFGDTKGTVILGSYGDAALAKPVIHSAAVDTDYYIINLGSDWRIMDLAFEGDGNTSQPVRYPGGVMFGPSATNSLLFRVEESKLGNYLLSVSGIHNVQAECVVHNFSRGGFTADGAVNGANYGKNDGNALIGNKEYDVTGDSLQHGFRISGGTRWYVAFNDIDNENSNNDNVTIRDFSDRIVVYRNTIHGHMTIRPVNHDLAGPNNAGNEHHIVVDSNLFLATPQWHGEALQLESHDIVIRNNIFHDYDMALAVRGNSVWGNSANVLATNNSVFADTLVVGSPDPREYVGFASVDAVCEGIVLVNNLFWDSTPGSDYKKRFLELVKTSNTPASTVLTNLTKGKSDYNAFYGDVWPATKDNVFPQQDSVKGWGTGTLTLWQKGTGSDTHTLNVFPKVLSTDPKSADFGKLDPTSPLKNSGTFAGAYVDYFGTLRNAQNPSIGAVELIN